MSSVAIILARGGSKRIPKKNVKNFCGKPLIAYSIQTALNSGCFDEVMVSTDSIEIADIALAAGAKVPFMRSAKNADDHATTMDALKEVIASYGKSGKKFDYFCCLYPAAVLVETSDLTQSHQKLSSSNADFLTSIVKFDYPIQRALKLGSDNHVVMVDQSALNKRSQDLEPFYHDAGQFYWGKVSSLDKFDSFWLGKTISHTLDSLKAQDIDTMSDWKIAEFKYKFKKNK